HSRHCAWPPSGERVPGHQVASGSWPAGMSVPECKIDNVPADSLEVFSPATATWFREVFARPTAAQRGAGQTISAGDNALVIAPTGSGKTLAAFLWALDDLTRAPQPSTKERCRVVYVSPLKERA